MENFQLEIKNKKIQVIGREFEIAWLRQQREFINM